MRKTLTTFLALAVFSSVSQGAQVSEQAMRLAKDNIIIDSHIDVPYRLTEDWEDVTNATQRGEFDYPRAVQGGLNAPFMSIYIPASYEKSGGGALLANKLIDSMEALVGRAPDKFTLAYSVADVEAAFAKGLIALPLGMENGTPIGGSMQTLQHFYDRGIRYITLAHSQANHISDSSYDLRRPWKGLSPFGKALVKEMNRLGIMIDISHVSDEAFYQVMALSQAPVIASHSSLRKFTPGFERNMSDEMVKALAANGGVIMINFGSSFISSSARSWGDRFNATVKEQGISDAQRDDFERTYRQQNPYPFASLDMVLDHIDYVKALVGIDHIGIGSDFDGVGDSLPKDLKDVSAYPKLIQGLLDRGYTEKEIGKILSGNFMRVWRKVEEIASQSAKS